MKKAETKLTTTTDITSVVGDYGCSIIMNDDKSIENIYLFSEHEDRDGVKEKFFFSNWLKFLWTTQVGTADDEKYVALINLNRAISESLSAYEKLAQLP